MEPLTERALRSCFVNASKGEVARMALPEGLEELTAADWAERDLLGWVDPRAPLQAYLVAPLPGRGSVGVRLRRTTPPATRPRARMCSLCATTHSGQGVALLVAPRAGRAGRDGNSVGIDACADLACSRYARGLLAPPAATAVHETLTVEQRVARLDEAVQAFLRRVLKP